MFYSSIDEKAAGGSPKCHTWITITVPVFQGHAWHDVMYLQVLKPGLGLRTWGPASTAGEISTSPAVRARRLEEAGGRTSTTCPSWTEYYDVESRCQSFNSNAELHVHTWTHSKPPPPPPPLSLSLSLPPSLPPSHAPSLPPSPFVRL